MSRTIVGASGSEEQADAIVCALLEAGLGKGGIRIVYPLRSASTRRILICVRCAGAETLRRVEAIFSDVGADVVSRRWPAPGRRVYTAPRGA